MRFSLSLPSTGPLEENNRMSKDNLFKDTLLANGSFCVTWEQVPGRGSGKKRELILANAAQAASEGLVQAIGVTDNPGGNPAYAAGALGAEIKELGIEPLVHLAMRDKNRNEIESTLYALNGAQVSNILIVSGDYPSGGAQPVFDLDPVHVLQLIERLNVGPEDNLVSWAAKIMPTDFFAGVAVSPFKKLESELMGQYWKLAKKIKAGARFVISQIGYDARKAQELLFWLNQSGSRIPVLANIYVLSYGMACSMRASKPPGCVISDKLLGELDIERQAADKGTEARLVRAAKMYAVAKGLGYRGVHIGGCGLTYQNIKDIINHGETLASQWHSLVAEFDYSQPGGFYLFKRDKESGLNTNEFSPSVTKGRKSAVYNFSLLVHSTMLEPAHPLFGLYRRLAGWIDRTGIVKRFSTFLEHLNKSMLFDCAGCGDCALSETGYLCPVSQCPKGMRVGPCGGSSAGWCEVYPGVRRCVWVRVFERLKGYGRAGDICASLPPPRDWNLNRTSAWLNFYMGRDHAAKQLGLKMPERSKRN